MLGSMLEPLLFPAPEPTYTAADLEGCLVWLPWARAGAPRASWQSPARAAEEPPGGLPCVWLPAAKSRCVLMYFHANAEDLGMILGTVAQLRKELQVNILAVEYPGYGVLKDMQPSEEAIYHAADAALNFLVAELGIECSQVVLMGRSVGGAPALYLASRFPVASLVLMNPFSSVREVAEAKVGQTFAWFVLGDIFPNYKFVETVSCPALFLHGADDDTVPPEHSKRLYELAGKCSKKFFVSPEGMNHNSSMFESPAFLLSPVTQLLSFPDHGRSPQVPAESFKPRARPAGGPGCAAARVLCGSSCKTLSEMEACDFSVPPGEAPLGDVRPEDAVPAADRDREPVAEHKGTDGRPRRAPGAPPSKPRAGRRSGGAA